MIKLHKEVEDKLKEKTNDIEQFVNDLLFTYLTDGFISKSEIAGMVVANKIYRKRVMVGEGVYDEITKEFKGVSVESQVETESLFIPDERLHDLVAKNSVILVMKSPRSSGIRIEEVQEVHITENELH